MSTVIPSPYEPENQTKYTCGKREENIHQVSPYPAGKCKPGRKHKGSGIEYYSFGFVLHQVKYEMHKATRAAAKVFRKLTASFLIRPLRSQIAPITESARLPTVPANTIVMALWLVL